MDNLQHPRTGLRAHNRVRIVVLSLGHTVADAYISTITPLWPVIARMFALTQAQTGWLIQLLSLVGNLGQPFLGYLMDRYRLRRLLIVAVLLSAFFLSTFGYIPGFWPMMGWLAVGFLGVALYHPRAGAVAAAVSGRRRALGMALFGAGGSLGCALGNYLGPVFYNINSSLTGLVYAMPVGLAMAAALLIINPESADDAQQTPAFSFRKGFLPHLPIVAPLFMVMLLRATTTIAFNSFIPFLVDARGLPLAVAGAAGLFFLGGGALGGLFGGRMSEWSGPRAITVISLFLSVPLLYGSLHTLGWLFLIALFASGLILRSAESVNIAQTQHMVPEGQSLATSLGMGLVWGIGGFITPLVGKLSDLHGQVYALTWVLCLPVIAAIIAFFIKAPAGSR